MKTLICISFAVGLLMGWRSFESIAVTTIEVLDPAKNPPPLAAYQADSSASAGFRLTKERVEIPRERLATLLDLPDSPALSYGDFVTRNGSHSPACFQNLATWCGLNNSEQQTLADILRKASDARRAWETTNVKVTATEAGYWKLFYPGDGGTAQAELKLRLREAFGPERATAVELGGDLENFFGLGRMANDLKAGRIEVRATRLDSQDHPDPNGRQISIVISDGEKRITRWEFPVGQKEHYTESSPFQAVLSWEVLLAAATEAVRGK